MFYQGDSIPLHIAGCLNTSLYYKKKHISFENTPRRFCNNVDDVLEQVLSLPFCEQNVPEYLWKEYFMNTLRSICLQNVRLITCAKT